MTLTCVSCGKSFPVDSRRHICSCGEPLELDLVTGKVKEGSSSWRRYRDLLPFKPDQKLTMGEGDTPLIKAEALSDTLDINFHLKNETVNPTWSFKDRGTILSVHHAQDLGVSKIGTVSTGNMATSVSAYGARIDSEVWVLVPDDISRKKLDQIEIYDPEIIGVSGDYGELFYRAHELSRTCTSIYFTNSNSPFRIEGYKTVAFELVEEMIPDFVMIPTSSGGLFRGIAKAFLEMERSGMIGHIPTLVAVQAEGCSPIVRTFRKGKKEIKRWEEPDTLAEAIANPYPPGGNEVLRKLKVLDGIAMSVPEERIIEGRKDIAREGISCQPASSIAVEAVKILRNKDVIEENSTVISVLTGSGTRSYTEGESSDMISVDLSEL